jgi:hypothetical protein
VQSAENRLFDHSGFDNQATNIITYDDEMSNNDLPNSFCIGFVHFKVSSLSGSHNVLVPFWVLPLSSEQRLLNSTWSACVSLSTLFQRMMDAILLRLSLSFASIQEVPCRPFAQHKCLDV